MNVHKVWGIGECTTAEFKDNLPAGFYNTIHSKVVTMGSKKGILIVDTTIYDMKKLEGR